MTTEGRTMESSVSVTYVESAAMSQRKKTVIDILRDSDDFVSGEAISDVLGISRNAVHKHVKSLRKRGYRIVGVSRAATASRTSRAPLHGPVTHRTENTVRSLVPLLRRDRVNEPRGEGAGERAPPRGPWSSPRPRPRVAGALAGAGPRPPARASLLRDPASCAAVERGAPADDRGGHRRGGGHREARHGARRDQVAERPVHRRPQGRRHPHGGLRRAGRGRRSSWASAST